MIARALLASAWSPSAGAPALLADMPGVTSAILDQLISAFNCTPDCVAVAPLYQENLQITTLSVAAAFRG
jgi:CTP:molybdopterin cytidylyltransferase MocA